MSDNVTDSKMFPTITGAIEQPIDLIRILRNRKFVGFKPGNRTSLYDIGGIKFEGDVEIDIKCGSIAPSPTVTGVKVEGNDIPITMFYDDVDDGIFMGFQIDGSPLVVSEKEFSVISKQQNITSRVPYATVEEIALVTSKYRSFYGQYYDSMYGTGIHIGCHNNKAHPGVIGIDTKTTKETSLWGPSIVVDTIEEAMNPGKWFNKDTLDYIIINGGTYNDSILEPLKKGGYLIFIRPVDNILDMIPSEVKLVIFHHNEDTKEYYHGLFQLEG